MLIPDLFHKWNISPKGIIHIGAHRCEEREIYVNCGCDDSKVIWIEGNKELYDEMKRIPSLQLYNAIIAETVKTVDFIITNNEGMSSSFLELKEHLISHPECLEEKRFNNMQTTTLSKLVKENSINMENYDFLVMDIQGAEYHALQGMVELLPHFKGMYIEVNEKELYENCGLLHQVEAFLKHHGFYLKDINMLKHFGWGDAYFERVS
jgi:FkbM family methyltransferase